jgi:anti-sigma factor RsiW
MKCEEVQILIEDYVDSALDQKAIAFVKSHMTGCSACTSFYRGLSREQEIYARYERDIEVTPALWASIESRIKQERIAPQPGLLSRLRERFAGAFAVPRLSPAFAAALVMIAIGITVGVMTFLNSRGSQTEIAESNRNTPTHSEEANRPKTGVPAPESPKAGGTIANNDDRTQAVQSTTPAKTPKTPVAKKNLNATAVLTPAQLVRDAEQKYLTAIAMLSRDVNRQRSQLDPMLLARLDASLSEIDRTIKETRRVVRENPGDPIALQYLLAAYSKKVEVLRGMTTD